MTNPFKAPKNQQLKWCNLTLMALTPFMLASSIQMEALGGDAMLGVSFFALTFIHAGFGVAMFALVFWHLYLHFGGVATLASGAFILAYMLSRFEHNTIGGIHGKIGFAFVALALFHLVKHRGWVKRKLFAR